MFRRLSVQEKPGFWKECFLSGSVCLLIVQIIFTWLWPVLISAGMPHNFGMMMRLPSTKFSLTDVLFLRAMASASAFFILGPALVFFRIRSGVSLLGLGTPWVLMAGFGFMSPSFPGGLTARLWNGSVFVAIGLIEWIVCVGVFYVLRRLGAFQIPPLYIG